MAIALVDKSNNDASTTSVIVTLPGGAPTDGDVMIGVIVSAPVGHAAHGAPADWTKLGNGQNSTTIGISMWWKVASSESDNFTFTATDATSMSAVVRTYSGLDTASLVDEITGANSAGVAVASQTTGTTGTTDTDDELIVVGGGVLNTHTAFGWSNSFINAENNTDTVSNIYTSDKIATATATFESTGSWSTSTRRAVALISTFRASGGAPPVESRRRIFVVS